MSKAIQRYVFANAKEVRVVMQNGEPWFVAKDVCNILEIKNSRDTLNKCLDEDERGVDNIYTPGGNQEMTIVSEAGLYSLILRSRKPEAKAFKRWVTHEVLPSIRKTGSYSVGNPTACQHAVTHTPGNLADALRMLADEWDAHELTMGVLTETTAQRDEAIKTVEEQNSTIREQQSHIEFIDSQRIGMAESCARFSPVKDKPCDDAKAVRGYWKKPALLADGEFNVRRNDEYNTMIRRAIRERSLMDYELKEFLTVIEADNIKGTKHTKDECTLLDMYNAGHIGIIPTII